MPWWERECAEQSWDWTMARPDHLLSAEWEQSSLNYERPRCCVSGEKGQGMEKKVIRAAAAKSLQSCLTLCDPCRQQPTRLHRPWDSPGKNTGVGCHLLFQCMKVKSESEVAQSRPTPRDPMDCSPPASPFPGILQARVLEWGAIAFSGRLFTRGNKSGPFISKISFTLVLKTWGV